MKITSVDREIRDILQTNFYFVPRFQRPYSWEVELVEEFWDDVTRDTEADYFIGSMVLYGKSPELGIVDGQQRLTTITMLIAAIRDTMLEFGLAPLATSVQNLIERDDLNANKRFVIETETSYPYFHDHIQRMESAKTPAAVSPEELALKNAYQLLLYKVNERLKRVSVGLNGDDAKNAIETELKRLRDKVLKLKVIFTDIANEQDAYEVFETLNTRGKDLAVADLVKTHLLRSLQPEDQRLDTSKEKWEVIRQRIEHMKASRVDMDTFLHHQWLSTREYLPSRLLYKSVRRSISSEKALEFLDELSNDSLIYNAIYDADILTWNREHLALKDSIESIDQFGLRQAIPFVLSVLREWLAGRLKYAHAKEAILLVENFHFQYTAITSLRGSGGIAAMYSKHGRDLFEATDNDERIGAIRSLKPKMQNRLPAAAEFAANYSQRVFFAKSRSKNRPLTEYVLWKFHQHLNPALGSDRQSMSIEHILSESELKNGVDIATISSAGNLVLVPAKLNNEVLRDLPFHEKKQILIRNGIKLDPVVANAAVWGAWEIEERTKWMANLAQLAVWKL
ncbi:MAG: DUF262 domain-containing protein [Fimbriimonadaceae bacterium]|nr:DUF262 domain-containing protein [Fimbriimonadaceae bacterium]